ncbi:hypothetical protein FZO59_22215, partial [Lelliottia nimipressuralis]
SVTANNNGVGILSLYDTRAGETKLTVMLTDNADVTADDTVMYVPDESSSMISNMTVVKNYALANFDDENIVTFEATDRYGNQLPGMETSAFAIDYTNSANKPSEMSFAHLDNGSFEVRLKGARATYYYVTVRYADIAGANASKTVWFSPMLAIEVLANGASADGVTENKVRARLYDGNEGPQGGEGVSGGALAFRVDNGAVIASSNPLSEHTDDEGYRTITLTNINPGITKVIAVSRESLWGNPSQEIEVNFEPVIELKESNLVIDPDNAPADGVSKNVVTATVTDQNGSPVSGAEVSFSVEDGPVMTVINGTSDAEGKAIAE